MPKHLAKSPVRRTNLRAWRKYRGLTQLAVQQRLGINVSHLSHIETGHVPLNEKTATALAEVYGCSVHDLLNREPGSKILPDEPDVTWRLLREIQHDISDMRNARTVMVQLLGQHGVTLKMIATEQRALRSQLDRFVIEMREELRALRAVLGGGDERGNG